MEGPLAPGTGFRWTSGGTAIQSRLALVDPGRMIGWTGIAWHAHAIHIWSLEPLPEGRTRVRTSESMNGSLIRLVYSSKALADSQSEWLQALKKEAER